jgi:hypothetical protein
MRVDVAGLDEQSSLNTLMWRCHAVLSHKMPSACRACTPGAMHSTRKPGHRTSPFREATVASREATVLARSREEENCDSLSLAASSSVVSRVTSS